MSDPEKQSMIGAGTDEPEQGSQSPVELVLEVWYFADQGWSSLANHRLAQMFRTPITDGIVQQLGWDIHEHEAHNVEKRHAQDKYVTAQVRYRSPSRLPA